MHPADNYIAIYSYIILKSEVENFSILEEVTHMTRLKATTGASTASTLDKESDSFELA